MCVLNLYHSNIVIYTCQILTYILLFSFIFYSLTYVVLGEISETFCIIQWCYLTKTEKYHQQIQVSTTASGDMVSSLSLFLLPSSSFFFFFPSSFFLLSSPLLLTSLLSPLLSPLLLSSHLSPLLLSSLLSPLSPLHSLLDGQSLLQCEKSCEGGAVAQQEHHTQGVGVWGGVDRE